MELRYENLKSKPTAFRSFTGFDVEEFQILDIIGNKEILLIAHSPCVYSIYSVS